MFLRFKRTLEVGTFPVFRITKDVSGSLYDYNIPLKTSLSAEDRSTTPIALHFYFSSPLTALINIYRGTTVLGTYALLGMLRG